MKRIAFIMAVTLLTGAIVAHGRMRVNPDEDAIRQTVEMYFDALMQGDGELLKQAFDDQAVLMASRDAEIMRLPFADWVEGFQGNAKENPETYTNQIVSIDVYGTAASVKTDLQWPEVHYVDYLSLLKVGGEWKVVNKIFVGEEPTS